MNQINTYIPRTTFKEKHICWKKFQLSVKNISLNLWIYHRVRMKKKILCLEKKQGKWAKSLSQAKIWSLFVSHFLSAPNKFLYKVLIILLDSISQDTRAYFIGSTKLTKKVVGLSTSNLTWLSSILNKKLLHMTSAISCWWLPCFNFNFKTLWPLFLWMGFNCLKATATLRRQFTFYHSCLLFSSCNNVAWWFRVKKKKRCHNPKCSCFT